MTQRERRKRRISSHLHNLILFGDTNERKYFNFAPMRICVSGVCGGTGRWHLFFLRSLARRCNLLQRTRVFLYQNVLQHGAGREITFITTDLVDICACIFSAFPLVTNNKT
jgi:hypothetical protein